LTVTPTTISMAANGLLLRLDLTIRVASFEIVITSTLVTTLMRMITPHTSGSLGVEPRLPPARDRGRIQNTARSPVLRRPSLVSQTGRVPFSGICPAVVIAFSTCLARP
jgi:hypothetical protein